MIGPLTIQYSWRPVRRSLWTNQLMDLFGLEEQSGDYVVAREVTLDVQVGDVVLLCGPSGSGKSSLLRAVGQQLGAVDAGTVVLPEVPLIDAVPGTTIQDRLAWLAGCGLSEPRWLLRCPAELSEGQRSRFRLAEGLRQALHLGADRPGGAWLLVDEFTATLDRLTARVTAFNLARLARRLHVGLLLATTHEDVIEELQPDLLVRCEEGGLVRGQRRREQRRPTVSFVDQLWLSDGTLRDWAYFARWHYRSHRLGCVRRVILLWHGARPVGICIFSAPAASLRWRNRFFGLHPQHSHLRLQAVNEQLWLLQRIVLHPSYRGAGIAAAFVRRACQLCPVDWIETLSALGHALEPFFVKAGFVRLGTTRPGPGSDPSVAYARRRPLSVLCRRQSRYSQPVYYLFDNRGHRVISVPPVPSATASRPTVRPVSDRTAAADEANGPSRWMVGL